MLMGKRIEIGMYTPNQMTVNDGFSLRNENIKSSLKYKDLSATTFCNLSELIVLASHILSQSHRM